MSDDLASKELSRSLFSQIKPYCIELSSIALLPPPVFKADSVQLLNSLADISRTLQSHHRANRKPGQNYQLALNLADYVFFPLSNLLQKPSLSDKVIRYIFEILGFLLEHVWSKDPNEKLIEQLYPLVLFLMTKSSVAAAAAPAKSLEFNQAGIYCLDQIVRCLPLDFFNEAARDAETSKKNLSKLGTTVTLLLDLVGKSANPTSQEEIEFVNQCFGTINYIFQQYMTPEQLSHVLPGTVSTVINFYTTSKTLHYTIIVHILQTLQNLIAKVFNDKSLSIEFNEGPELTLEDLGAIWDKEGNDDAETSGKVGAESATQQQQQVATISVNIPQTKNHRTNSWLRATSKQLKISLTILFKDLLGASSNNRIKVQTKNQIETEVVSFVKRLVSECFFSLFNEFVPLALDIFPMLLASVTDKDNAKLEEFARIICMQDEPLGGGDGEVADADVLQKKQGYLYDCVVQKLEDLVKNKISTIMLSVDHERIRLYLISLKFQFSVLDGFESLQKSFEVIGLKAELLALLQGSLVRGFLYDSNRKKLGNKDILSMLSGMKGQQNRTASVDELSPNEIPENKFDEIELPPHIDARKISNIRSDRDVVQTAIAGANSTYASSMILLGKGSSWIEPPSKDTDLHYFGNVYTNSIEDDILELIKYVGSPKNGSAISTLKLIESITSTNDLDAHSSGDSESYLHKSVNLWIANSLLAELNAQKKVTAKKEIGSATPKEEEDFNIDEFLQFDEEEDGSESAATKSGAAAVVVPSEADELIENISYVIVEKSQELIDEISGILNNPETVIQVSSSSPTVNPYKVYEMSYSVAIDSIGVLSHTLKFEDFQQDFLVDYLYPLLEALSFQSIPSIQAHAKNSIQTIVDNYYNGSLQNLIMDNSDYLIDCLSLKLSVVSSLTPSLPGIFLIILKISGIKLLLDNQLGDVLNEMFTLIDSYHGYSTLVEGFFIVFDELISQVDAYYDIEGTPGDSKSEDGRANNSKYRPWGMTNISQLLTLIDDSEKIIDPFKDYDSSKEYFKRKPGVPFAEQMQDSDDEEEEGEGGQPEEDAADSREVQVWKSPVPKTVYSTIQKIFNYGFRLLSHPSTSLRFQILEMLSKIYPILSTDYQLVLPLISKHWPVLLTLVAGTSNLSTYEPNAAPPTAEAAKLVTPALELTMVIFQEDKRKNDTFLGRKFIEMWEFLGHRNALFQSRESRRKGSSAVSRMAVDPKILSAYVGVVLTGLGVYERIIPDTTAYDMVSFCWRSGINQQAYGHLMSKETKNILWVLQETHSRGDGQEEGSAKVLMA